MIIELILSDKKYAIVVETSQFIPQSFRINQDKESKNFGIESSSDLGYFTTLDSAVKRLIRESLCTRDESVSLSNFVASYKALSDEISKQLPNL